MIRKSKLKIKHKNSKWLSWYWYQKR